GTGQPCPSKSTVTIEESGMVFGPYNEGECFRIEASEAYRAIQTGVMMAEFLLIRNSSDRRAVWIIEAKSRSPHAGAKQRFDEFIGELREKLVNALHLGLASCLGRHRAAEHQLPQAFRDLDLKVVAFRLIVVIKGHEDDWLPPLDDALNAALNATIKTWALGANSVVVINDRLARARGLISNS
ncbi:MAG: hypothetical protein U0984_07670, partial [Prosthecobacter sp.]|nr:hypothetical protein [Prosthecobacter sp.]